MGDDFERLKNPPIVEAVVGVGLKGCSFLEDDFKALYKTTELHILYPKCLKTNKVQFSINKDSHTSEREFIGYNLAKDNENLFIEKHRLTLSDKNKYEDFENLIAKYETIWNEFSRYFKSAECEIKDIALRYINKFKIPLEKAKDFKISPVIVAGESLLQQYAGNYNLISGKYSASANIQTVLRATKDKQVEIIFDIDVHNKGEMSNDLESIKAVLSRLKLYENEIFFNNIENTKEYFGKWKKD